MYCKWGNTIAGLMPTARGNGGGRGARASCLYTSDPDKGPDSWSNRDDRKTCTIYKGDDGEPQELLQQTSALLDKEASPRLGKQGNVWASESISPSSTDEYSFYFTRTINVVSGQSEFITN